LLLSLEEKIREKFLDGNKKDFFKKFIIGGRGQEGRELNDKKLTTFVADT